MKEEQMRQFLLEFPDETTGVDANVDDSLTFQIEDISPRGQVVLKFSEPVFQFDKLNTRSIDVPLCMTQACEEEEEQIDNGPGEESKDWVQVEIIAG